MAVAAGWRAGLAAADSHDAAASGLRWRTRHPRPNGQPGYRQPRHRGPHGGPLCRGLGPAAHQRRNATG
eukprot:337754-Chlamydomonas_euryale.AAC.1